MATTDVDGPLLATGQLTALTAPPQGSPVQDPNPDAGPSGFAYGVATLDARFAVEKDRLSGYVGRAPALLHSARFGSIAGTPSALASNNIAAAQGVTNGTPMTLASANATGISVNVPFFQPGGYGGTYASSAVIVAPVALDFGWTFGNVTAGSAVIPVGGDIRRFVPGMPLVIVGAGAGGACLLTRVASTTITPGVGITAGSITVDPNAIPQTSVNPTPIGTGNIWPAVSSGQPMQGLPTAAWPGLAAGVGGYSVGSQNTASGPLLLFDPSQGMNRGVRITGASGGAGGTFLVTGADNYGYQCTDLVTVAAGASTGYSLKTFKYILSIVPQFTDAGHNYVVGTVDLFGFNARASSFGDIVVVWANALMTSSTGFVTGDTADPATNATGNPRGTIQLTSAGPGSGIGSTASNGTVSGLSMTGNQLQMYCYLNPASLLRANPPYAESMFGTPPA